MTKNQEKLFDIICDELIGYVNKDEITDVVIKIIDRTAFKRLIIIDTNDIESIQNKIKEGE